uniref:Uncharacterized protein n=1 Tax=Meloidogyne incognita TaxID=6306 RepID=A0A914M5Y4_MELIC
MAILQKALCTNNNSQQNNYRTVLTNRRESPDSGLELEQRNEVSGSGNEEITENNGERKLSSAKQQNKKQNSPTSTPSTRASSSSFSFFNSRIFGSFLANNSSHPMMFDFPTLPPHLLDPNGYAQSPVGQLSRSNAVLMRENQQLTNRVQDLENSLRDHVAHLNSVYFTLHQHYGFDALQLPGGELVHLSQFKGPEVVLLTFVHNPKQQYQQQKHRLSLDAHLCVSPDDTQKQQQLTTTTSSINNRRNRLLLLQQKQLQQIRHKQPPLLSSLSPTATSSLPSQFSQQHSPPSTSSDSACYSSNSVEQQIVSGPSSAESSSISAAFSSTSSLDPVEMLRQLCIKSSTDQQSTEQIQGYVGWLKEQENGENKDEEEKQRLLEYFRAQQVQAQVQQPLIINEDKRKYSINTLTTASSDGWRSARSETVPSTSEQQNEDNCEKPPNSRATWPPRFPLMNKTRKFRSIQFLGNRRSTSSSSVSPHPTPTTTALLSGNHRGNSSTSPRGISGIGRHSPHSPNNNERKQQKTRIGIGPMATAACRNTLRIGGSDSRGGAKRNLL